MFETKKNTHIIHFQGGELQEETAAVIGEMPVSLTVNGEIWLTFMCTPIDLEAMAVGFLFNEGLLHTKDEIADVRVCPTGDNVDVWLHHAVEQPKRWRRTSGCTGGITSVETPVQIKADSTEVKESSVESMVGSMENPGTQYAVPAHLFNGAAISPEQIYRLQAQFLETQNLYSQTGGVHTSALSDGRTIRVVAEDIGRHNTLDKIAGRCMLDDLHPDQRILITTGRISSEMLQKSVRLGAAVVISRTSPSSLSVAMAERWGVTLIGYARRNGFSVYAHPERILEAVDCIDCR